MQDVDPALIEMELRARVGGSSDPWDEAVWHLLLGQPDLGLSALRRSLPDLSAEAAAGPQVAYVALIAAGADEAANAAAATLPGSIERQVEGNKQYHGAMLSLIAGDEERARAYRAELDTFVTTHDRLRGGQPSVVAAIPGGLLERDAGRVAAGLDALLAWHLRRARARSEVFNSSRGLISLDAIVALILAQRRGLDIPVAATYRAARVPMLAVHSTEFDGRPLPRALPFDLVTDLVAGPWLRATGVPIEDAPPAVMKTRARTPRPRPSSEDEAAEARLALERRVRLGGSAWQLASWALMLGDAAGARGHLVRAAEEARQRWRDGLPSQGGPLRWFRKDLALPNQNLVREHFGLALVLGDEAGLREAGDQLRAWLGTQEGRGWPLYGHASGYLDLICDLLGGDRSKPTRSEVQQVSGGPPSARVAAIGLTDRDPSLVREGIDGILAAHAAALERKTSPPPSISEPAAQFAVAARRLGVAVTVDDRYAAWPVPVDGGQLPVDLLGRALWSGQA